MSSQVTAGALALGPGTWGRPAARPTGVLSGAFAQARRGLWGGHPGHSLLVRFYCLLWGSVIVTVSHFAEKKAKFEGHERASLRSNQAEPV